MHKVVAGFVDLPCFHESQRVIQNGTIEVAHHGFVVIQQVKQSRNLFGVLGLGGSPDAVAGVGNGDGSDGRDAFIEGNGRQSRILLEHFGNVRNLIQNGGVDQEVAFFGKSLLRFAVHGEVLGGNQSFLIQRMEELEVFSVFLGEGRQRDGSILDARLDAVGLIGAVESEIRKHKHVQKTAIASQRRNHFLTAFRLVLLRGAQNGQQFVLGGGHFIAELLKYGGVNPSAVEVRGRTGQPAQRTVYHVGHAVDFSLGREGGREGVRAVGLRALVSVRHVGFVQVGREVQHYAVAIAVQNDFRAAHGEAPHDVRQISGTKAQRFSGGSFFADSAGHVQLNVDALLRETVLSVAPPPEVVGVNTRVRGQRTEDVQLDRVRFSQTGCHAHQHREREEQGQQFRGKFHTGSSFFLPLYCCRFRDRGSGISPLQSRS